MEGDFKIVNYDLYCQTCKNYLEDESDPKSKCWDCLDEPVNQDSHKPINYEEKDEWAATR